jgi:hypothetical protein
MGGRVDAGSCRGYSRWYGIEASLRVVSASRNRRDSGIVELELGGGGAVWCGIWWADQREGRKKGGGRKEEEKERRYDFLCLPHSLQGVDVRREGRKDGSEGEGRGGGRGGGGVLSSVSRWPDGTSSVEESSRWKAKSKVQGPLCLCSVQRVVRSGQCQAKSGQVKVGSRSRCGLAWLWLGGCSVSAGLGREGPVQSGRVQWATSPVQWPVPVPVPVPGPR